MHHRDTSKITSFKYPAVNLLFIQAGMQEAEREEGREGRGERKELNALERGEGRGGDDEEEEDEDEDEEKETSKTKEI